MASSRFYLILSVIGALAASAAYFAYTSEQNRMLYEETIRLLKEQGFDECYIYSLKHKGEFCYIVVIDDKRYRLTGEAANIYGMQLSKEESYKAIELRLPYLESDAKIHLIVTGPQERVQSFISGYELQVIQVKKGTLGWITKDSLGRFVSEVSMSEYMESGLNIDLLGAGTICDETGCIGPFEEELPEEQSKLIAKALEDFRSSRVKEILTSSTGIEVIARFLAPLSLQSMISRTLVSSSLSKNLPSHSPADSVLQILLRNRAFVLHRRLYLNGLTMEHCVLLQDRLAKRTVRSLVL